MRLSGNYFDVAGGATASPAICLRYLALALCCAIGACSPADNEPGPGGVTVGEARALDEAAEMLDAQRIPEEVLNGTEEPSDPSGAAQTN